jgi:hypothetical protein
LFSVDLRFIFRVCGLQLSQGQQRRRVGAQGQPGENSGKKYQQPNQKQKQDMSHQVSRLKYWYNKNL